MYSEASGSAPGIMARLQGVMDGMSALSPDFTAYVSNNPKLSSLQRQELGPVVQVLQEKRVEWTKQFRAYVNLPPTERGGQGDALLQSGERILGAMQGAVAEAKAAKYAFVERMKNFLTSGAGGKIIQVVLVAASSPYRAAKAVTQEVVTTAGEVLATGTGFVGQGLQNLLGPLKIPLIVAGVLGGLYLLSPLIGAGAKRLDR